MLYHHFLFYCLIKDTPNTHPLQQLEYDVAFEQVRVHYDAFQLSVYNDRDLPEYECIVDFLKNVFPIKNED